MMQSVIVIYHHPQECWSAYLTFISQKTGQVLEYVNIPEGYNYSGMEMEKTLKKVGSHIQHVCQSPKPTPENVHVPDYSYKHGRKYISKVSRVDITGEDTYLFPTWEADVHIDTYIERFEPRFDTHADHFKSQMQKAGFDMNGWCLYKRRKTNFNDFLTQVIPTYKKNYKVMNVITIG